MNDARILQAVLADDLGLDLAGWTLDVALGISADGLTIVGQGINPNGDHEAWIAVIAEPVPVLRLPGYILLASLILVVAAIPAHRIARV